MLGAKKIYQINEGYDAGRVCFFGFPVRPFRVGCCGPDDVPIWRGMWQVAEEIQDSYILMYSMYALGTIMMVAIGIPIGSGADHPNEESTTAEPPNFAQYMWKRYDDTQSGSIVDVWSIFYTLTHVFVSKNSCETNINDDGGEEVTCQYTNKWWTYERCLNSGEVNDDKIWNLLNDPPYTPSENLCRACGGLSTRNAKNLHFCIVGFLFVFWVVTFMRLLGAFRKGSICYRFTSFCRDVYQLDAIDDHKEIDVPHMGYVAMHSPIGILSRQFQIWWGFTPLACAIVISLLLRECNRGIKRELGDENYWLGTGPILLWVGVGLFSIGAIVNALIHNRVYAAYAVIWDKWEQSLRGKKSSITLDGSSPGEESQGLVECKVVDDMERGPLEKSVLVELITRERCAGPKHKNQFSHLEKSTKYFERPENTSVHRSDLTSCVLS